MEVPGIVFREGERRRGLKVEGRGRVGGGGASVTGGRGMKRVALSLPKPPGSSLVPLHTTRLSFFESISSSTLTPWTAAREAGGGKSADGEQGREVQNVP